MIPLLMLVPLFVTLVLGPVYLLTGAAGPGFKAAGITLFGLAVYLQFFSRFALAGMLIQVALAFSLALWRRMESGFR